MENLEEQAHIAQFLEGSPENYIDRVILQIVKANAWGENFDREEVIQNARLALLKSFKEGKYKPGALSAYVQRIAEFECINEMRRYYRTGKHHQELSEETLELPDPWPDPLTQALETEEKAKAVRILVKLDKPCRKLLFLKFFNGLTYKEITGKLPMTEVNVRVSIFRCLKKSKAIALEMEKRCNRMPSKTIKEIGGYDLPE
jgi:RNA polymerase sigma factor (sigma-70 family)